MAKFAFIVPPLTGHINPTLALGQELLTRNHEVSWLSFDPQLEKELPVGGKLLLIPINLTEEEKKHQEAYIEELKKKSVTGIESLKFLYEEVLTPMNTYILPGIEKIIDQYKPDLIISDHQLFAGSVAAIKKQIPYATSVTAPASIKVNENLPMIHEWESQQVIAFQQKNGIEGNERLDCSKLLTLVYTSKDFFGNTDLPDNFKFIGPSINKRSHSILFDWEKLADLGNQPKILVTIGTTFDHSQKKSFFDKITNAFKNEKLTVVVISDPEYFDSIPDNFIIQKQIPQLDLIHLMNAVVCHGGQNTVCESLTYGIPLIVIPIAYDQSYVAGCVVDNNAGIRLKFNRFKAEQLKESVHHILNDKAYKIGAENIKKSFEKSGGVVQGANYLESILNN
ncbi:glycosyltransferase [Apibacter raozihei]|uniref:nucleotide disphospho-sugar-binding domain-containing protein n=1 Tax=Apibacter raozihei TaxID=2500547 RepID=UPI000FE43861|nr:nucleotide disphospho-sugar-binding domain-containing protein [Apibacter raozihei]